jgi:hypothetical protein
MTEPNLLMICLTAFMAVIVLLGILAGTIRILMAVFPEREAPDGPDGPDGTLLAALTSAAHHAFPGMRVTKVEEIR